MDWPTPQEYNEAIQNTRLCFFDEELQSGTVTANTLGLPRAVSGSFASVYCITCGDKKYAVRCFLHNTPDLQSRYERLSKTILSDTLECTVDFSYQAKGIKVGNGEYPILKMAWVEGENLDTYVRQNYSDKQKMTELQTQFRSMLKQLADAGFAHGDLQHGNIIVGDDGLRLVDYDGMFVPALSGMLSNELGHRNFQHPGRTKELFGSYLDNFSAWVIDTAFTCLIEDSTLYKQLHKGDEAILLRAADFKAPDESEALVALEKHDSAIVRRASRLFRTILTCLPYNVPPLSDDVSEAPEHPKVVLQREQERHSKQLAEWAAAEAASRQEDEHRRATALAEKQKRLSEQATAEHPKPNWLDDTTATALSTPERRLPPPAAAQHDTGNTDTLPTAASIAMHRFLSVQDYADAIADQKNLDKLLSDCEIDLDGGRPRNMGMTNAVFHVHSQSRNLALKLFTGSCDYMHDRYEVTAAAIKALPPTVSKYIHTTYTFKQAINVRGDWKPAVATKWDPTAIRLDEYLRTHKPDFDYTLLNRFRTMMQALQSAGIAHGCLQPDNILVLPNCDVFLVDYDNFVCHETLANGFKGTKQLAPEYCHPLQKALDSDLAVDRFPSWLIDTIILCWSEDRVLWQTFSNSTNLFFRPSDLTQPHNSRLLNTLAQHQQYEIADRGRFLLNCLQRNPQDIPPLTADGLAPVVYS